MLPSGAIVPRKLRRGDTVRVVAPARSARIVTEHAASGLIEKRFAALGLRLTFGEHVDERDDFDSSSVASRVADLHAAFADPEVAGIITAIGGFNSNELLPYLDWDLIGANPKIFCGYSDALGIRPRRGTLRQLASSALGSRHRDGGLPGLSATLPQVSASGWSGLRSFQSVGMSILAWTPACSASR